MTNAEIISHAKNIVEQVEREADGKSTESKEYRRSRRALAALAIMSNCLEATSEREVCWAMNYIMDVLRYAEKEGARRACNAAATIDF